VQKKKQNRFQDFSNAQNSRKLRSLKLVNYSDINFLGNKNNGVSVPATHGIDPSKTKLIQTNE